MPVRRGAPETQAPGGAAAAPPRVERPAVLLVDDHQENLLALEAVLHELGCRLVKAGSGREALRRILEEDFAVILLDVQMPEMDGFETASLIRGRERSKGTPIVFLTAVNRSDAFVFKGYSLGAVDYILKPFVPDVLKTKVRVFVELFEKTEQIRRQALLLEAANRELKRSNEDLQDFAFIASHDLREPLRKIASFADLMVRRCQGLDTQVLEYVHFITDGVTRMQSLIDGLLQYSKVGRGEVRPRPVEIGKVLEKTLSDLSLTLQESGASVTYDPLPTLPADPLQLGQLFSNLIGNAVKFRGSEPPRVHVKARRAGGEWVFEVQDNGIGIAPAYHEKVFTIFKRLHPHGTYPGTGIGLAICRKVVERHGGRIWVESQLGSGATFFFTMPDAAEEAP